MVHKSQQVHQGKSQEKKKKKIKINNQPKLTLSRTQFSTNIVRSVESEPCHIGGMQRARSPAKGNIRRCIVVLQSLVRAKERSVLFVGSVAIAGRPGAVLPEPRVGLLVAEEVVVVRVGFDPVAGKVIWRLESEMRPAETRGG